MQDLADDSNTQGLAKTTNNNVAPISMMPIQSCKLSKFMLLTLKCERPL